MKQALKVIILICLCLFTQAVSVLPHHHHGERACMHHKAQTTHSAAHHSHQCKSDCITKIHITLSASVKKETNQEKQQEKLIVKEFVYSHDVCLSEQEEWVIVHPCALYFSHHFRYSGLRAPPQLLN